MGLAPAATGVTDETARSGTTLPRVRALDGLRGIAVIAVLLYHDNRLLGGYLGVDLFFVLSGFLITSLLLAEFEQHGRIRLRHFYERRARRLLPALGIALIGVAVYAAVWAQSSELPRIRWDGIATLFYFQNWHEIVTKQSYFDAFTSPSPLQHTWSLSIEEQFYAIWPLIVIGMLSMRRSVRALLAVTLTLGVVCATFAVVAAQRGVDQRVLYYSTFSRAPSLLMGAALAALVSIRGPVASRRGRITLELVAIAGAAYLGVEWARQPGDALSLYKGPLLLCGVAAVAVIAAAAHPDRGPISRVLSIGPLVGVGLISYGLYLFHWPVFLVLSPARTGLSGWPLFGERVAVTLGIALLSYFLVEQPIRHGSLRPARAVVALATATALVAAALVVTTRVPAAPTPTAAAKSDANVVWPEPVAPQLPNGNYAFLPPGDWSRLTDDCDIRPQPVVRHIGRTAAPKVLVIGDSVGCFIGAALDINQVHDGIVSLNRAHIGCPMVATARERTSDHAATEAPFPTCIADQAPAIAAFEPDVAVLMVGAAQSSQAYLGQKWVAACEPAFDAWYEQGAARSIAALGATGATVVVVTLVKPPPARDLQPGATLPQSYERDIDCENRALRAAVRSEPRAHLLDLDAYVCPQGRCRTSIDGVTLRTDGVHFQAEAADAIAGWLLPRALKLAGLHARPHR